MNRLCVASVALLALASAVRADVKPNALISENMILQQGVKAPLWGTAEEGEKVTVSFNGQEVSTTTKNGKWLVHLEPLKAGGPHPLTITGKNTLSFKNVLVGEVWIASGQSNMEWPIDASAGAPQVKAASKNPMIRLFTVPKKVADKPQGDTVGNWVEAGPDKLGSFSAVGYFFGRDLNKSRNVPVGIINTSWGGTIAEAWTPREALEAKPDLAYLAPKSTLNPGNPNQGTALYNGMIAPLVPYAVKGAIWYQGESNAGRAYEYRSLMPTLIQSWRDMFQNPQLGFYIVQLAPWMASSTKPMDSAWAELREAQLLTTQKLPNTGIAVITDFGDTSDIHPRQKEPVGARLALAARANTYGEKITYSGPTYDSMSVDGNKAILSFKNLGKGLDDSSGDALLGFTVAGADGKFYNAFAQVQGDKVAVWSGKVEKPAAVRYGWSNYPVANLYNKDGLPASPFRTDDFQMVTAPKKPAAK